MSLRRLNYNSQQAMRARARQPPDGDPSLETRPGAEDLLLPAAIPYLPRLTVSVFQDQREASNLDDVSVTGFFNDFDFTRRAGRDFITTIISFIP